MIWYRSRDSSALWQWDGNHRTGVTLAMCRRLSGLPSPSTCQWSGLWRGRQVPFTHTV